MTALMWAAFKNNVDIIQLLLRVNTKMNMRAKVLLFKQHSVDALYLLHDIEFFNVVWANSSLFCSAAEK